jgi:valyl-tRNA synthetase
VTPAHDKTDFEIGQRHKLEVIDIMHPNAVMNDLAGADLAGLERFAARKKAVEVLTELGALEKEEPYRNNVGYSERADVPIEPRLSEQWFLKYPSVEKSRDVVSSGEMKFFPDRWAKVYDHWMEGIQDWCISRQLWWGHRIPVWYLQLSSGEIAERLPTLKVAMEIVLEKVRIRGAASADDATSFAAELNTRDFPELHGRITPLGTNLFRIEIATDSFGDQLEPLGFIQDADVLDTWFSSWLWPFATMGWPEKTDTLAKFYPTTDMVTGPDIIFFWVARMIMAGFEYTGELPFRNVYFTGIIRDKQGRKMSKSLGNSPDPLDLISKYGADALRFGVMRSAPLGADVVYDEKNVELGRNFCTKLWNAARFRQMQGGATEGEIIPQLLTADDKWILLRLDNAVMEVSAALEEYRFSDATQALYRFFWSEFCDWYLECSKAALATVGNADPESSSRDFANPPLAANTLAVMDFVLSHTLRLFHPFLPFITEELWQGMGFNLDLPDDQGGKTIMNARWPQRLTNDERHYLDVDPSNEEFAQSRYEVVNAGRGLRRDFNIASNKRVRFVLRPNTTLSEHDYAVLRILLNAEPLEFVDATWSAPKGTPTVLTPLGELFLPLEGLVDVAAERERLGKEVAKVESELTKVRAKLADPNFSAKVPAAVLDEHRQREATWAEKLAQLQKMREALS